MTIRSVRGMVLIAVACAMAWTPADAWAQKDDKAKDDARRPSVSVAAQPNIAFAPARINVVAELVGGVNDYEAFYCPTVVWEWGDGTTSESTFDCEPFEAGKSEIRRRFSAQHIYRAGRYRIVFRLLRQGKAVTFGGANVRIQPGVADSSF